MAMLRDDDPKPTRARMPRWLPLLPIVSALPALATLRADADLWWHLLVGRSILGGEGLPSVDTWSYTAGGRPWIDHEWLPEVLSAAAHALLGNPGLVLLRGGQVAAIAAGLAWLVWRRLPNPVAVVLAVSFAMAVILPLTNARPHSWTWLLTVVVLVGLELVREGRTRAAVGLPLVLVLWVNLHGGFLFGWGVAGLGLGLAALGVEGPRRRPSERALLLACALGVAFAPLFNAYGLELHRYVLAELSVRHPGLPEWLPPTGGVAAAVALFSAVPLALAAAGRAGRPTELVALLVCTTMAARHAKFVVLVAIVGVVVGATGLGRLWARHRDDLQSLGRWTAGPVPAVAASILFLLGNLAGSLPSLARGPLRVEVAGEDYPVQAVAYLAEHDLGGKLALPLGWGGYARWHLGERYLLSLDGRNTTVYDPDFVARFTEAFSTGDLATVLVGEPDVLLVPLDRGLYEAVLADPGWELTFRDPVAAVFVRAGGGRAAVSEGSAPALLEFPG